MDLKNEIEMIQSRKERYTKIIKELEMLKEETTQLIDNVLKYDYTKNEAYILLAKLSASVLPVDKKKIKISYTREAKPIYDMYRAIGFEPNPKQDIIIQLED